MGWEAEMGGGGGEGVFRLVWTPGGWGVPIEPRNPYPFLILILAEKVPILGVFIKNIFKILEKWISCEKVTH